MCCESSNVTSVAYFIINIQILFFFKGHVSVTVKADTGGPQTIIYKNSDKTW
jgi:hypothetical protein